MDPEIKDIPQEEAGAPASEPETYSQILDRSLWTRKEFLIFTAGWMIQAFAFSFESNMYYGILGYVTGFFTVSSLGSILPTILQILQAALVPFYVKICDVVGRAESITVAMLFYLIGFTIQGSAKSFVELAVGQIFYGMGSTGVLSLTQVLIADTTLLIDRGIMFAMWDLPGIASIFAANALIDPLTLPKENEREDKWRMGFLAMGLISVCGALCLLLPLWYLQLKGKRAKGRKVQRRSFRWFLHEFDVVGAILITAAMSLTLLPLILAKSYEGNWKNGKILGMICSGVVFTILLVIWEAKFTDRPIMSMRIWTNRTAFGALVITFVLATMSSVNYQYFTLYLVIARNLTFGNALLLERGYPVVWIIAQLGTAVLMKRFKVCRLFVWVGLVIHVLGTALMIPARLPESSAAFVVISQAVAGAGAGIATVASTISMQGVVSKDEVATVIGAQQILSAIGYGVGGALAGGVWTQYLPGRLAKHITGPYDENLAMNDPLKYIPNLDPVTKGQLVTAYGDSQMLMSIITCCLAIIAFICALFMRPVDLLQDQPSNHPEAKQDAVAEPVVAGDKAEVK
ncbi:hypothetical protein BGW42_001154 [Actinomortierella wolfii]|nr:hypothetical protein BGW42_001154 [Actinomortierella wolfii]